MVVAELDLIRLHVSSPLLLLAIEGAVKQWHVEAVT